MCQYGNLVARRVHTFRILSALVSHSVGPFFSVIVSTRRTTWVAEIFESDDCPLTAELGLDETLEDRSNL